MPYARWLHKGESHLHEAADLKELCASFPYLLGKHGKAAINCSASARPGGQCRLSTQCRSTRLTAIRGGPYADPYKNP